MLYYDRIAVSEEIDVNKTSASKECDICYYCYFLNYSFKFNQMSVIDVFINLLQNTDLTEKSGTL